MAPRDPNQRSMSHREESMHLVRTMMLIRRFETTISELAKAKSIPGWLHLSIGQEAVAAGACAAVKKEDWVVSGHRAHGHALAKGMSTRRLAAELYGKETGCCRGMGGSMHLADAENHVLTTSFVGQGYNLAAGLGLSSQVQEKHAVVEAFGGDGSTNTGAFHESLNLCAIWKLPVVFIVENNGYAVSTKVSEATSVQRISDRAASYGIPGITIDGNDVWKVRETVASAVENARKGKGPSLIECLTYRHHGHYEGEQWEVYRPGEEVTKWVGNDPIVAAKKRLSELGVSGDESEALERSVQSEVEDAISFAEQSPFPNPDRLGAYVLS